MAPLCLLKAVECGIDHIDTALSAFAGGTSHTATETMVAALQGNPRAPGLDLQALKTCADYFRDVRGKYHQFESEFTSEDVSVQINQVPGGMMSNLANQLKEQGAVNRIGEVFEEIPKVREDLGYPPLVTPTSQIVGTQAVVNVLAGERYKTVTNEVKRYLLGHYGAAPAPVNEALKQRAVGAEEAIDVRPADLLKPELAKLRTDIGELAESEEDVLIYAMFPDIGRTFLEQRAAGTLTPEPLQPPVPAGKAAAEGTPTEFVIDVHGESYQVAITGVGIKKSGKRHFYLTMDGMPEEVVFEPLNEYRAESAGERKQASAEGHVTTSIPGNIVTVLVKEGDRVKAGQPVLVTEAMKMEAEVQATIDGMVAGIFVAKGDRVTPGEVLVEIQP